jgi:hypothetical protein
MHVCGSYLCEHMLRWVVHIYIYIYIYIREEYTRTPKELLVKKIKIYKIKKFKRVSSTDEVSIGKENSI